MNKIKKYVTISSQITHYSFPIYPFTQFNFNNISIISIAFIRFTQNHLTEDGIKIKKEEEVNLRKPKWVTGRKNFSFINFMNAFRWFKLFAHHVTSFSNNISSLSGDLNDACTVYNVQFYMPYTVHRSPLKQSTMRSKFESFYDEMMKCNEFTLFSQFVCLNWKYCKPQATNETILTLDINFYFVTLNMG